MWEITLVGKKEDYVHFVLLEDMLNSCLKEKPYVAISYGGRLLCSIAIQDRRLIKQVKRCILETIIKICKEEYFRNNVNFETSEESDLINFILISIVMINLQDEADYASVKATLTKVIYIRSFCRFKLKKLYKVWDEIIKYFNIIIEQTQNEKIYLEFLRFLTMSTVSSEDIMYLEQDVDSMLILDKNKKLLSSIPKSDEIGVIVNLIVLSPKRIIINCYDALSDKVAGLIEYIFHDRISILL